MAGEDRKLSRHLRGIIAFGKSCTHGEDDFFSQRRKPIVFSCELHSFSVATRGVMGNGAPFQIAEMVVCWICVNVINDRVAVRVGDKRQRYQSMHKQWFFLSAAVCKMHAKMASVWQRILPQRDTASLNKSTSCTNGYSFRQAENVTRFAHRVTAFKANNIFPDCFHLHNTLFRNA